MDFKLEPIGRIVANEEGYGVVVEPQFRRALTGLEGFSYVQLLWWFTEADTEEARGKLVEEKPYQKGPDTLGVFATRSPERPNPLALSTAYVTYVDVEEGVIGLAWVDAFDGTPVFDIKPYTPSADRVAEPQVPSWCAHWPSSVEDSEDFDWGSEFNF